VTRGKRRCYNRSMSEREDDKKVVLRDLLALHEEVDREAARTVERFGQPIKCRRGCTDCCVDRLTVFEIEAERIRRHHADLLSGGRPHPEGKCAFLDDEGACLVYDDRPYVCRTQGLPLRWLDRTPFGETVEMRDICPLNDVGEEISAIGEDHCWTIGPFEGRLAGLQSRIDGGQLMRIPLRALFIKT